MIPTNSTARPHHIKSKNKRNQGRLPKISAAHGNCRRRSRRQEQQALSKLQTDAKAPPESLPWADMTLAIFVGEFLVKGIRIRPFCREQLNPLGFFKLVTHEKRHCALLVSTVQCHSRGVKHCSCSHPQNARLPVSLSSLGMTTSCSATQFRKTSLPISVSRGGSYMLFKATQWANVEEGRAVISVSMRLTFSRLLEFSQARGPILWKSLGRQSCSMHAPQNVSSGSPRG